MSCPDTPDTTRLERKRPLLEDLLHGIIDAPSGGKLGAAEAGDDRLLPLKRDLDGLYDRTPEVESDHPLLGSETLALPVGWEAALDGVAPAASLALSSSLHQKGLSGRPEKEQQRAFTGLRAGFPAWSAAPSGPLRATPWLGPGPGTALPGESPECALGVAAITRARRREAPFRPGTAMARLRSRARGFSAGRSRAPRSQRRRAPPDRTGVPLPRPHPR